MTDQLHEAAVNHALESVKLEGVAEFDAEEMIFFAVKDFTAGAQWQAKRDAAEVEEIRQKNKVMAEHRFKLLDEIAALKEQLEASRQWVPELLDEVERLQTALREEREKALDEAARACCTIDGSDSSHDTAESNAAAIRALKKEKDV